MLERVWRKGNPLTLLVGMQTSTATMENNVEIPLKTGNRTVIWPSNPTAGHTHWGNKNWKRHVYPNVLTVFYFIAMMSLARLRVIIRKIPMKSFIVTTVMMLARMLFTNLPNFLLGRNFCLVLIPKIDLPFMSNWFVFHHMDTGFCKRGFRFCLWLPRSRASL